MAFLDNRKEVNGEYVIFEPLIKYKLTYLITVVQIKYTSNYFMFLV